MAAMAESSEARAAVRSYYEQEAIRQLRRHLVGPRVDWRDAFLDLLHAEERTSVVDFGAGPGRDGEGFVAAGLRYLGVDLAHGNGVLAAADGMTIIQASVDAVPIRSGAFQAGWSMSTLMHLPEPDAANAAAEMARVLEPGAPMMIGMWGGDMGDRYDTTTIEGEQRLFSQRPFEVNTAIIANAGAVVEASRHDIGADDEEYHLFLVRTGD